MFEDFLTAVKEEIKPKDLDQDRSQIADRTSQEVTLATIERTGESSKLHREQLLEALRKENPDKVLAVMVRGNKENAKTLRTINDGCRAVARLQEQRRHLVREEHCLYCSIKKIPKRVLACIKNCFCKALRCWDCCSECCTDEQQPTEDQIEEEKQWIEILSNPLYISVEWLWKIAPREIRRLIKSKTEASTSAVNERSDEDGNGQNSHETTVFSHTPGGVASTCAKDEGKEDEDENQDVIATALRDSHLLEMIAGNDLHQHKDEYQERANEVEEFAIAVVEGSTRKQLIDLMDTKGDGCLKEQKLTNFSQSLSLLKIAADERMKKFVASEKCESILNEVVYFGWPGWQKKKRMPKILWSFLVQLSLSILLCIPYTLYRAFKDCRCCSCCCSCGCSCCCSCCGQCWPKSWKLFRQQFEHPYSKFVNHTTWYMVFLAFLIAASLEDTFGRTWIGLEWIDWVIIAFVVGLLVEELLAAIREGFFVYFSKWWNVIDSVIIFLFILAFTVWVSAYFCFGNKWKPEKREFIAADVIFSSAIIISFFHLTHIFQVDSVLGPLQLSLYRMLRDVWKFLLLFLVLYLSFATGLAKMYSYYVASEIELHRQNITQYERTHYFASHWNTLSSLFWLLLGNYDQEKVIVKDPKFVAMSISGQIFMIVYVVCMVIVALNMLIATMNTSYERIMDDSYIWRFSRARMWLESIDKGNVIPSPLNLVYYFLKVITKVIVVIVKTKCCCLCHCNCEKGKEYFEKQENIFQNRLKEMKRLVVKFLEDRYTWDGKKEESNKGKSSKRDQVKMKLEDLRQQLAKVSSEIATLSKQI